jgi:hypothetical protein
MSIVRGIFSGILCFLLFAVLVLLGLVITVNLTVLNPDFVTDELDKLDVYPVLIEQAKAQLPGQELLGDEIVDELVTELTPWFEEQADGAVYSLYAYLHGEEELNVVISLEQVRALVKEKVREFAFESLPPELLGATQSQIEAFLAEIYEEVDNFIPATFQLNEASLGQQVVAQLEQVREVVGYIDMAYKILIAAAALLVVLIALALWWQPTPIMRAIGITFVLVGVAGILGSLLFDAWLVQALSRLLSSLGVLLGFQAKMPQLAADIMAPVRMYGIGFLSGGIVLVAMSFLFRTPKLSPVEG